MAFSRLLKAFRPITRDLSKHTTDFIQEVQVNCVKSSVAKKLSYQKNKNTAYCSLRNEMGRNEMEMEICSLRNGNLYFAKWKSVVCEMKICSLRNENL